MALTVNTNILSLNAQRNLRKTEAPLQRAMQRLSSGLRLNSAKDDAAGLAIATRMGTQVRALSVAIRNTNDGLSIVQTAEGAISELTNSLQRMYELAEQAASYNTSSDRNSLNQEVSQLIDELSRVVNQTRYNGQKLLAGGFSADIQVGVTVNETINVSISNLSPSSMGIASNYSTVSGLSTANLADRIAEAYYAAAVSNAQIEGVTIGDLATTTLSSAKITQINNYTSSTGVKAFGYGNGLVGVSVAAAADNTNTIAGGALVVNGISIDAVSNGGTTNSTLADGIVSAINAKTAQHGVTAVKVSLGASSSNVAVVLTNTTGAAITLTANSSVDTDVVTFFADGTTSINAGENGAIVLNDSLNDTSVSVSSSTVVASLTGVTSSTSITLSNATVNSQVVTSAAAANLAMLVIDQAIETINGERAILGAKLNRFESVVTNLENVRENLSAARSRIMDADFAAETANLTKAMITQQAGISVLAQANSLPQNVLALLQG
ncbi:MAG TPA: flagellin [Nitrospirae bacterium]|nr:flagellin [Nitrospirota bacterium]